MSARWLRVALVHLPAGLSALRLLALPWVVGYARRGERSRWSAAIGLLIGADLMDGILARRIGDPDALRRQRALDGPADAALTIVAPLCAYRLRPHLLSEERVPLLLLATAQAASATACLGKFRRLPRYHTRMFRWSIGALGFALAGRVLGGRLCLAFRPAVALVTLAHVEALAITLLIERYQQPVRTIREIVLHRRTATVAGYLTPQPPSLERKGE
ncbi:MAG: CDP-alcohol phosphatidyltransferase family protein [Dehalococcoidia bacterium]